MDAARKVPREAAPVLAEQSTLELSRISFQILEGFRICTSPSQKWRFVCLFIFPGSRKLRRFFGRSK